MSCILLSNNRRVTVQNIVFFGFHRPFSRGFDSDVSVKGTLSFFKVGESGSGGCQVTGSKKIRR
jgi:hypothetical protein